jgi:hypothetical protein
MALPGRPVSLTSAYFFSFISPYASSLFSLHVPSFAPFLKTFVPSRRGHLYDNTGMAGGHCRLKTSGLET